MLGGSNTKPLVFIALSPVALMLKTLDAYRNPEPYNVKPSCPCAVGGGAAVTDADAPMLLYIHRHWASHVMSAHSALNIEGRRLLCRTSFRITGCSRQRQRS